MLRSSAKRSTSARAEAALARSEELRRLQAAQEAKDEERKRLAEELHDETLAHLTSFIVELGFISRGADGIPTEVKQVIDDLQGHVRQAEQSLRQIVQGLFPSVLTNLGLLPAIRSFMEEVATRPISNPTPIELELVASGLDGKRLPEPIEIAVYRVAQQGLFNAIQHAKARSMKVELNWADRELALSIADDGDGFDLDNLENNPASGHFGLVNLKDRIEMLDGVLRIESTPSEGTALFATVPTPTEAPDKTTAQRQTYFLRNQDAVYSKVT